VTQLTSVTRPGETPTTCSGAQLERDNSKSTGPRWSRVPVIALGVIALAATLASPASAGTTAKKRCATQGTTIAANETARIYRRGGRDGYIAYACLARSGKTYRLGSFGTEEGGAETFAHARTWVAFDVRRCVTATSGGENCLGRVTVMDVRTGRKRSAASESGPLAAIDALLVSRSGNVAWLRSYTDRTTLRKLDSDGEALLDSGGAGEITALALGGETVYWTRGDTPRSALLR
jgi:hypothetical protein